MEFIQITDTHVVDLSVVHSRLAKAREHFAGSGDALARFFAGPAAELKPAFLLHTGDISDAYCFDRETGPPVCHGVERFLPILRRSPAPIFLALGNHDIQIYRQKGQEAKPSSDYTVAERARKEWAAAARHFRKATYYSFSRRAGRTAYLFLVLDNGERRLAKDSPFAAAQLAWLKKELSGRRREFVILVMHVPLGEDSYSAEIKSALAGSGRIILSIAGHRHSDGLEEIRVNGSRFVQVRTAAFGLNENNWRRFRLHEDRIEIGATGKAEVIERTVNLPAARRY